MAKEDAAEITEDGKAAPKRRFDKRDWDYIAEFACDEFESRKKDRRDTERAWDEIDRQVAMVPDVSFKYVMEAGQRKLDKNKAWMSEVEPPLQAQALEVLTADARRMLFPDSGNWFSAHAEVTDEYLRRVDFHSLIKGDETEVPSQINQDNADKLIQGFLAHIFNQTDFETRSDRINAEAFKYGMGVGRARMEAKTVFIDEARGVRKQTQRLPVLVPCSIRNHYLDKPLPSIHSSQVLGPMHIAVDNMRYANLVLAASKGSTDPNDPDGGWMPDKLAGIEPENGYVKLLELEGDVVVPRRTTRSMILPGCIVTVAIGGKDKGGSAKAGVIRFRWRKSPQSSYLLFPYHYEGADDVYATSPLMKGRPVQIMVSQALNRLLDSAMLKTAPPVSYDRTDPWLAQNGGPPIHPFAQWASSDPGSVKAHTELGGDPSTLAAAMQLGLNLYAELTGVLPGRLGAQTVSHTTAFAKDAELTRGAVRTVDYVRQVGKGAYTRWLGMAYQMARDSIGREGVSFYIDAYGGFVDIGKEHLPDQALFEWFGSGGPQEEVQKSTRRMQALGMAMQMDQLGAQFGRQPRINLDGAQAQVLREGGWTDVDAVLTQAPPAQALPSPQPGPTSIEDLLGAVQ